MSDLNGGFSYEEHPVISLAKEVMNEIDRRDEALEESLVAFEEAMEQETDDEAQLAEMLVVAVSISDRIYNDNITKISCKYVQTLGKDSIQGKILTYMLGETHGASPER